MGINIQYKWVRHTGPQSLSKIMGGALSWASWTVRIWGLGLGAPPFCHSHNHHNHRNRASKWQPLHGVVGYILLSSPCKSSGCLWDRGFLQLNFIHDDVKSVRCFFHTHCVQDRLEGGRSSLIQGAICGLPESSVRLLRSAGTQRTLISGSPGSTKSWSQAGQLTILHICTHHKIDFEQIVQRELVNGQAFVSIWQATLVLLEVGFIIFWSERVNMKDWSDSGRGPNWIAASRVNL